MKRLSVHTSWVHTSTKSVQSFEREVVINTNNLFLKPYKVHMDASGFVIGGVFTQDKTTNCL
jgi:hypothetical protein